MPTIHRHKYGFFFHPDIEDPQKVASLYTRELLDSFVDTVDPSLGRVEVKSSFEITRVDGLVVFACHHEAGRWAFIKDDIDGPMRAGLMEALDWWNSETILVAPAGKALEWDRTRLPNAWTNEWRDGLVLQTITQYPKGLGKQAMKEWNPGLVFLPFEFTYEAPTPEQEQKARADWARLRKDELHASLSAMAPAAGGTWYATGAIRYRGLLSPDPRGVVAVGSRQSAEAWAVEYRGLCYLVDAATGEQVSRWAER